MKPKKAEFPKVISEAGVSATIYRRDKERSGRSYVEFVLAYSEAGKRVMRYFADYDEADKEARLAIAKIASGQAAALELTGADRDAYLLARQEVSPTGRTLLEVAKEYKGAVEKLNGMATLAEAAEFYARYFADVQDGTVREIVVQLLAEKAQDGRSAAHLKDLTTRLKVVFCDAFGSCQIKDIRHDQLEAWLRKLDVSARSRVNYLNAIRLLFRFARNKRYLPKDRPTEADDLSKPRVFPSEIEIFTPAEMRKILSRTNPERIPFVVLGGFAGIRTAEIMRLQWEDIHFDQGHIVVGARQAKTARRRLVPISPNLARWLAPFKDRKGPICRWKLTQALVQREVSKDRILNDENETLDKGIGWKSNALRHSYASYRLAKIQNRAQVAEEIGNSVQVVASNYREVCTSAQAEDWFSIIPDAQMSNLVPFVA